MTNLTQLENADDAYLIDGYRAISSIKSNYEDVSYLLEVNEEFIDNSLNYLRNEIERRGQGRNKYSGQQSGKKSIIIPDEADPGYNPREITQHFFEQNYSPKDSEEFIEEWNLYESILKASKKHQNPKGLIKPFINLD